MQLVEEVLSAGSVGECDFISLWWMKLSTQIRMDFVDGV